MADLVQGKCKDGFMWNGHECVPYITPPVPFRMHPSINMCTYYFPKPILDISTHNQFIADYLSSLGFPLENLFSKDDILIGWCLNNKNEYEISGWTRLDKKENTLLSLNGFEDYGP